MLARIQCKLIDAGYKKLGKGSYTISNTNEDLKTSWKAIGLVILQSEQFFGLFVYQLVLP